MNRIVVVGGQQRRDALSLDEWSRHQLALVVGLDPVTGAAETLHTYTSPPEVGPEDKPSILFKAASLRGDRLDVCTQTEVLSYAFPSFERRDYITLPCFNDLHHVLRCADGRRLIANTGLDMVVELDADGQVAREWSALGDDPWARFDRAVDYRRVQTTKPHRAHPNYTFELDDGEIWVTRFEQKDAVSLTRPGRRIDIAVERPHDGIVRDGRIHFTTVDGHVVIADGASLEVIDVIDLNALVPGVRRLGWCRGLAILDDGLALVGFSRLRPTRWKENLGWLKGGVKAAKTLMYRPAQVGLFDLARKKLARLYPLDGVDISVLFSIHALD